ncbi:MAG: dienelactone hydrolase family protein [Caulobacterales bacterium]
MPRICALAILLALALAPSWAQAQEKISIPSETPGGMGPYMHREAPPATVVGYLYLPANATGPVPALILKHGSGGLKGATGDNIRKWAKTLTSWGVAAFVVDSFGPRGISETASDQSQLRIFADLADSFAALKVLAADPRIDKNRIGIMGWSRGGSIAMVSALESARRAVLDADGPKFAAHIVFYGAASNQFRDKATDGAPMLFFHGESDNYVPVGPTVEFADWIKGMGNAVTFVTYPRTYHDFDVEGGYQGLARDVESGRHCDVVTDMSTGRVTRMGGQAPTGPLTPQLVGAYMKSCMERGGDLAYNAQARSDAVIKVHAFLQQVFHIAG